MTFDLNQKIFPNKYSDGKSLATLVAEGCRLSGEFFINQNGRRTTEYYKYNKESGLYEPAHEKDFFDYKLKREKV